MTDILIIDGDAAARMYLKLVLTDGAAGADAYPGTNRVRQANAPAEALRLLTSQTFDIVFIGDSVGTHSGVDFLAMMKSYELATGTFTALQTTDVLIHAELDMRGLSAFVLPPYPSADKALWLAHSAALTSV